MSNDSKGNYGHCELCKGKKWVILEFNPMDKTKNHCAPCIACSSHRNLNDIEKERNIKIQRTCDGDFYEETVQ